MNKHILLGISGGIAAYKSCELVRLLKKQGHSVTVAMSRAATEFVSPLTFQALSGNPVLAETHSGENGGNGMAHINLTREADVFLIAPASANTLAKIANGIADNLLTNLAAARKCPLAVAPAMNVEMWFNSANLRNIAQLQADGITVFPPASGEQACGEVGVGRMPEAAELADLLPDLWTSKSLQGKKVLITAGATFEAIDPVRGITNLSSGQMGMALARACRAAGAEVSLIYGQLQTGIPAGLAYTEQAVSAEAMYQAVMQQVDTQDVFISVAAVADYKVKNSSAQKIKKDGSGTPPIAGPKAAPAPAESSRIDGQIAGVARGSTASPAFLSATAGWARAASCAGARLPTIAVARPSARNSRAGPGENASCGVASPK